MQLWKLLRNFKAYFKSEVIYENVDEDRRQKLSKLSAIFAF